MDMPLQIPIRFYLFYILLFLICAGIHGEPGVKRVKVQIHMLIAIIIIINNKNAVNCRLHLQSSTQNCGHPTQFLITL